MKLVLVFARIALFNGLLMLAWNMTGYSFFHLPKLAYGTALPFTLVYWFLLKRKETMDQKEAWTWFINGIDPSLGFHFQKLVETGILFILFFVVWIIFF